MSRVFTTLLAGAAAMLVASPASASLVFDANIQVSGQGFGVAPRALTVQSTGNDTSQSGCVGVASGGGIAVGQCQDTDATDTPNGVINDGGDEAQPQDDNQKFGIPTTESLGIVTAADIGILFNAVEPGGDGINLTDLTLKFFTEAGVLLGSIDGQFNFDQETITGNGGAGFIFRVEESEQAFVNNLLGLGGTTLALEATFANFNGGAESFAIVNLNSPTGAVPEPGTWAMMLIGFGGMGVAMRRRRRTSAQLAQVA
jgi:hypothetical protein